MMKRAKIIAYLALVLMCAPGMSLAQSKIGFVNLAELMTKAPQSAAAEKKLQAEFSERENKVRQKQKSIQKMEADLEKNALVMKAADLENKQAEINKQKRSLKREAEELQEDFNVRSNEERQALQKTVLTAVDEVGKENNFDIIIAQGVMYVSDKVNITDLVLKKLSSK
jgi:outer membrane protein